MYLKWAALWMGALLAISPPVLGDEPEGYARVVIAEAELRSGPGVSYRVIHRAHRGDTLFLRTRSKTGFWLRVALADGREAFVLGDVIEPLAIDSESGLASKPGFFAPPELMDARGGFAIQAGVFDLEGYMELRPALLLAPTLALEPYFGVGLAEAHRRLLYGGAVTLSLAPDWALAPFVSLGAGGTHEDPSDEFVQDAHAWFHARAGGGLLVSLRWRILLRLEVSNIVLFNEDEYQAVQSYTGGIGTYF